MPYLPLGEDVDVDNFYSKINAPKFIRHRRSVYEIDLAQTLEAIKSCNGFNAVVPRKNS